MEIFTLTIKETERIFGFKSNTLYNWIGSGKLIRGHHYIKVSNKVLIKRKEFIKWMEEEDGCQQTG